MKLLTSLIVAIIATGIVSADTQTLFNGKNLDGWVIESGGKFSVKDGKIHVNQGVGWLRSEETFGDFTLIMEFRFLEEGANSGIFIRTLKDSRDDENGWPVSGYQVQCRDTTEGTSPLGAMINYGGPESVDVLDRDALINEAFLPTGEWNRYVIHCEGDRLTVILNGKVITRSTGIKNSPGHVGIQGEHGLLEFRKIEIVRY